MPYVVNNPAYVPAGNNQPIDNAPITEVKIDGIGSESSTVIDTTSPSSVVVNGDENEIPTPQLTERLKDLITQATQKAPLSGIQAEKLQSMLAPTRADLESAFEQAITLNDADRRQFLLNKYGAILAKIDSLESYRKLTEATMKDFGELTGAQIAKAVKEEAAAREGNGVISAESQTVLNKIQQAIEAQLKFAEVAQEVYNASRGDAEGLYDLATMASARATEINMVAMTLAYETDETDTATLNKLAASFIPRQALEMHGTADAINLIKKELEPLCKSIDDIKRGGFLGAEGIAKQARLLQLGNQLAKAQQALELVANEGIAYGPGEPAQRLDPTIIKAFGEIIADMKRDINALGLATIDQAVSNVIDEVFPDVSELKSFTEHADVLAPLLNALLGQISDNTRTADGIRQTLTNASKDIKDLKPLAIGFAAGTVDAVTFNTACKRIRDKYAPTLRTLAVCHNILTNILVNNKKLSEAGLPKGTLPIVSMAMTRIRRDLSDRLQGFATAAKQDSLSCKPSFLKKFATTDMIKALATRLPTFPGLMKNGVQNCISDELLKGFVTGKYSADTIVGAVAWGATPDMIDPRICDKNLVEVKKLGAGVTNTVYLCTYRNEDGTTFQRVFKPEFSGRESLETSLICGGHQKTSPAFTPQQQVCQLNMASQDIAKHLGTQNVIVKNTVGCLNGTFGLFMELAEGISFNEIITQTNGKSRSAINNIKLGELTIREINSLEPEKYARFFGNLMHTLNDLEWTDFLTGQGDRHGDNYKIYVGADLSVTIKGIDNDDAFVDWRLGMTKFKLTGTRIDLFAKNCQDRNVDFSVDMLDNLNEGDRVPNIPNAYVTIENGKKVIIFDCDGNAQMQEIAAFTFGTHRNFKPKAISAATYLKLQEMNANLDQVRLDLAKRNLTDAQIEATIGRIKEAWAHAQELANRGRMISPQGRPGNDPNAPIQPDGWSIRANWINILAEMYNDHGVYTATVTDNGTMLHLDKNPDGEANHYGTPIIMSDFINSKKIFNFMSPVDMGCIDGDVVPENT